MGQAGKRRCHDADYLIFETTRSPGVGSDALCRPYAEKVRARLLAEDIQPVSIHLGGPMVRLLNLRLVVFVAHQEIPTSENADVDTDLVVAWCPHENEASNTRVNVLIVLGFRISR
mmetsp:Transcript_41894/g.164217  ORF Transcript_41894/g.164217 Transcript_41894/m.164217 type:complete len:116 (-) Transcript_41894:768-1115(-)